MSDPRPLCPEGTESRALAESLALAFRDNPLNRAVIGGSEARRLRANRAGMRATLAAAVPAGGVLIAPGDPRAQSESVLGGLIAMEPGHWPLGAPPWGEQLRLLIGQGWRTARRWGEVFEALRESHPVEPHCYLSLVGIRPNHQGRGHGAALVAHWLEGVDRQR
ncbi:GNAT family N-acetyltransferase, partial [Myxococcota bacterium]|nr:GNAT family N-acetyltransferase [Myxococcota bacterium]